MSAGGGSSIVGGRFNLEDEVVCLVVSPDETGDDEVVVVVDVVVPFPVSCLSRFSASLLGGGLGGSKETGSMAIPARLANEACLSAEGVVNGTACWHDADVCTEESGLRRGRRAVGCDVAAGSVQQRPPVRKSRGYRKVRRFVAMVGRDLGGAAKLWLDVCSAHMPFDVLSESVGAWRMPRGFGKEKKERKRCRMRIMTMMMMGCGLSNLAGRSGPIPRVKWPWQKLPSTPYSVLRTTHRTNAVGLQLTYQIPANEPVPSRTCTHYQKWPMNVMAEAAHVPCTLYLTGYRCL